MAEGFARIDAAVAAGKTDLRVLGFWKLVALVKNDPALVSGWADVIGRIDREAFERRVRVRAPVWMGNAALTAGIAAGALAVVTALHSSSSSVAGLGLVVAAGLWSVAVHCPAHWLVGRMVGIRFRWYFVGGPFPPRPGLKADMASYLRTPPERRAWMHASGALATKVAPFVALAFYPASHAPAWAAWVVLGLGAAQIATDVVFSTKSSDWMKVKRERRVARTLRG